MSFVNFDYIVGLIEGVISKQDTVTRVSLIFYMKWAATFLALTFQKAYSCIHSLIKDSLNSAFFNLFQNVLHWKNWNGPTF